MSTSHPGYNKRQKELIIVASISIVVQTVVVILRIISRRLFHVKLWWDDYLCVLALFISYLPHAFILLSHLIDAAVHNGLGLPEMELSPDQSYLIGKYFYPLQLAFQAGITVTFLSVVALYIRVFPNTWLQKWSYYFGIVFTIFNVTTIGVFIFQCKPIRSYWDDSIPGTCIDQSRAYIVTGGMFTVMTVVLFLLPVPVVWTLQMSTSRRWGLIVTFSVGAFVVVTTIVRIAYLTRGTVEGATLVQLWASLEIASGLLGACIPSMMPLMMFLFGKKRPQKVSRRGPSSFFGKPLDKSKSIKSDEEFSRMDEVEAESVNTSTKNHKIAELKPMTALLNDHSDDQVWLVNDNVKVHVNVNGNGNGNGMMKKSPGDNFNHVGDLSNERR